MNKKCLIINGSPKTNGNTHFLINKFVENCSYDVEIINAYQLNRQKGIKSCLDCGACLKAKFCIVNDAFKKITDDDYDLILIASPIFQSNLPGPMINILNRFNFIYNNKVGLNIEHSFKQKDAALILLGGGHACKALQGNSNEDLAIKQAQYIFNKTNSILKQENIILCLNTNNVDVQQNQNVINQVVKMAKRFN